MSFGGLQEKEKSIENGIKIAEFIQRNRGTIQKTYGRSAITKPATRDRATAWEQFIGEINESSHGHERDLNSGDSEEEGQSGRTSRAIIIEESLLPDSSCSEGKASDCGSNNSGDVEDIIVSDADWSTIHRQDNTSADRRRNPNCSGTTEPEKSCRNSGNSIREDAGDGNTGSVSPDDKNACKLQLNQKITEPSDIDMENIMEDPIPIPKRRITIPSEVKTTISNIKSNDGVIKKTTGENSQSTKQREESELSHSAIQSVPGLQSFQSNNNADVECAQQNVNSAHNNQPCDTCLPTGNDKQLTNFSKKLDIILENQDKILNKLGSIAELKEEIKGIKQTLINQSLTISTIEKYISEMMIAIPKSGIDEAENTKSVNPDLRMVIGRDKTRGLKDLTKKYEFDDKIQVDLRIPDVPKIDPKYIQKPIDNSKNNAAKFVPSDDISSLTIILNIIRSEISDKEIAEELKNMVKENYGTIPLKTIYSEVESMISEINGTK